MKQERKFLQEKIYEVLDELNKTDIIKELINSDLINDYMNKRVRTKILTINMTLDSLSVYELYHIVRLINLNKRRIHAEEYFTDEEMSKAIENKNNLKVESNPIIELENVLYSKNKYEESWICVVSYKQIYDWLKAGYLTYSLKTQRQGTMRKIGKKMIIMPYVNEKSVNDMVKIMLKGEFYSNMISFNVTPDFNHRIDYSKVDRTLKIDTEIFTVNVTDGWHRITALTLAIEKAFEEGRELQGDLYLKVTNMETSKAQQFIRQQAKTNAMNEEYFEKFNPDNKITKFINDINTLKTENTNPLYSRIDLEVNTHNTWLPFEVFKEGLDYSGFLKDINNTDNNMELRQMENFIIEFFNTFYKIAEDNGIDTKQNDTFTDATFIMGLLITAHLYYKNNDIDIVKIDKFIKKFKISKAKYTFDHPIKSKDKTLMRSTFEKLLEVNEECLA